MPISADAYPSRAAVDQADSGVSDLADLVHPAYSKIPASDDSPVRETVQPEDLHHNPAAPRPGVSAETLGAMHRPVTTLRHDAAHEPGMPVGWTSAKNPE